MASDSISPGSRENAGPAEPAEAPVKFDAPAVHRKWPSLRSERRAESGGPYLLIDGTLDQCIVNLMAKPAGTRHLYEVHTLAQLPLVNSVLSGEDITELARLRDFL
jgi:5-keto 4-deoxyuronate isomerase